MVRHVTDRARAITFEADTLRLRAVFMSGVAAIFALVIAGFAGVAVAAGSDSGSAGSSNYKSYGTSAEFRKATVMVNKEAFADALPLLKQEVANDPSNADAWNLIGFSSRKMGDYAASEAAYDKALAIDPKHKGALEYKGELYLTMGNLAGAEALLVRLRNACSFNCGEVKTLKDAIAAYKKGQ